MYRRIAVMYTVLVFVLGFLCVNIVTIISSPAAEASQQNNRRIWRFQKSVDIYTTII